MQEWSEEIQTASLGIIDYAGRQDGPNRGNGEKGSLFQRVGLKYVLADSEREGTNNHEPREGDP